jgi:sugar phosphate permease
MGGMAASGGWIEGVLELALRAVFGALRGWDDLGNWGFLLLTLAAIIFAIWMLFRIRAKKPETRGLPDSKN